LAGRAFEDVRRCTAGACQADRRRVGPTRAHDHRSVGSDRPGFDHAVDFADPDRFLDPEDAEPVAAGGYEPDRSLRRCGLPAAREPAALATERRRRRRISAVLTVVTAATGFLAAASPGSGHSDRGASPNTSPALVSVTLRDDGCILARTAVPRSVTFRILNRGRYAHVFSVDRRRVRVAAGRTAVLHVEFAQGGRHVYACSRRALPPKTGRLTVASKPIVT